MGRGLDLAWSRLPDYMTAADDGTLSAWLGGVAAQLDPALATLTAADPDTSVSGSCEIADPARASRGSSTSANWLGWLGWLVGVDTSALADADVRDVVGNAASAQRRGSIASIRSAVASTLTGSKHVRVYSNISGVEPYLLTVVTLTGETPDSVASLAAAWTEKPAGVDLELQTVVGSTWADVVAEYDTWTEVVSTYDTWDDLITWIP